MYVCSVETGEPPLVKIAANLFSRRCYKKRESAIAGIICAGWDKKEGGQVRVMDGEGEEKQEINASKKQRKKARKQIRQ